MTDHIETPSIRELLARNPLSYNELLDLFEAYVLTIGAPLQKAANLIHEELDYREGNIFQNILTPVDEAAMMAKRIKQIRAAHNKGTDVTITLSRMDALRLEDALSEVDRMFGAAAGAIEFLHARAKADSENEDAHARAIMALTERAMMDTDEREGAALRQFADRLQEARQYQQIAQEEAA
ncbi:MAG: hypothetical protein ACK4GW_10370 [Pseudorhodobacter sp.]